MAEFGRRGRQSLDARPSPLAFEESQEGWIADQAIGFMRASAEAGKPFLVHAGPPRPHPCTAPSEPFWSLYAGKELSFCALAGLEPMATSDGHDLSPMLRGEPGDAGRVGVTECPWSKSIRKGTYRLVRYPRPMFAEEYPGGFGELYDLATDPWEMRNLYFDPAHTATVAELQRDLMDWLIATTRVVTLLPKVSLDGCQTFTRHGNSYELDGKLHPRHVDRTRHANYL